MKLENLIVLAALIGAVAGTVGAFVSGGSALAGFVWVFAGAGAGFVAGVSLIAGLFLLNDLWFLWVERTNRTD